MHEVRLLIHTFTAAKNYIEGLENPNNYFSRVQAQFRVKVVVQAEDFFP